MSNGFEEILDAANPPARELAREARSLIQSVYPAVVEVPWPKQRVIGYGVGPRKMSEHFCYISVSRDHINIGIMYGASCPTLKNCWEAQGSCFAMCALQTRSNYPIWHYVSCSTWPANTGCQRRHRGGP